jgi:hypothetical protein
MPASALALARTTKNHDSWRPQPKTVVHRPKASAAVLFGDRTVEPHAYATAAGRPHSFPFIDSVSGSAQSVSVYLGSRSHAKKLIAGLYSDRHGRPGSLLGSGSRASLKNHAWNRVTIGRHDVHAGRIYWITLMGQGGRLSLRVRSGGCQSVASSTKKTMGRLPATWRRGRASANCPVSAFARGKPSGAQANPPSSGTAPGPSTSAPGPGTPAPLGCPSATPNVPDGPDPWGGCFPGPGNTGIPAGTVLTPYTGPCTVTTNNLVIDAKTIDCGPLTIAASNVQITRSLVNGEVSISSYPSSYSFTISDSEVIADSTPTGANDGATGIGNSNFVAIRDNVHGGIRSIWCEFNCTEQGNWLHGQLTDPTGAAHESGTRMGENSIITHNSIVCDAPNVPPDAGCSADLTGYGDFEVIESDKVSNNLFIATEGGTCAYGGSTPDKPYSDGVHDIVFANNIFQRGQGNRGSGAQGHCGYWFGISDFDASAPGDQWTNNRWDDGTVMPSNG